MGRKIDAVGGNVDPMPMFEQAMEMLSEGRIDIAPIMTHVFSFRDFPEAYHKSSNYEDGVIKSLITWQDDDTGATSKGSSGGGGVAAVGTSAVQADAADDGELRCLPCGGLAAAGQSVPTRL